MSKVSEIFTPARKFYIQSLIDVEIDTLLNNTIQIETIDLEVGIYKIGKVPSIKSFTLSGVLRMNKDIIGIFDQTPVYAEPDQPIILRVNGEYIVKFYKGSGEIKTMRDLVSVLGDKSPLLIFEEAIGCSPKTIASEASPFWSENGRTIRQPELTEDDVVDLYGVGTDLSNLF